MQIFKTSKFLIKPKNKLHSQLKKGWKEFKQSQVLFGQRKYKFHMDMSQNYQRPMVIDSKQM